MPDVPVTGWAFFLESGANQRRSKVICDRAHGSISECKSGDSDREDISEVEKLMNGHGAGRTQRKLIARFQFKLTAISRITKL